MRECVLICGFGISGRGAARLALRLGKKVAIADEKDSAEMRQAAKEFSAKGAEILFGWKREMLLPSADTIILSPGIRKTSALYQALPPYAKKESELGFALKHIPCPFTAITGTNGKTTTTELVTAILNACGKKAMASGNVGNSLSDCVCGALDHLYDFLVIEVSSFQLESLDRFPPCPAAVLNLASDHIDRHGSMEEYAKIKFGLLDAAGPKTGRIVNTKILSDLHKFLPGKDAVTFSAETQADFSFDSANGFLMYGGKRIFDFRTAQLKGIHNAENMLAALALTAASLGEDVLFREEVRQALRDFKPEAHRMEVFAEKNGIRYVEDSKATNPHAVNAAVAYFAAESGGKKNQILLLGGLDKGMDFTELEKSFPYIRKAFLAGACSETILKALQGRVDAEQGHDFADAVRKACMAAEKGDIVMLSPATASMDLFKNYAERGDTFKRLVREYLAEQS